MTQKQQEISTECTCGYVARSEQIASMGQNVPRHNADQLCLYCRLMCVESTGPRCYKFSLNEISLLMDIASDGLDLTPQDYINIVELTRMRKRDMYFKNVLEKFKVQSGEMDKVGTLNTSDEQEQNVNFADDPESTLLSIGTSITDSTFDMGYQENASLARFLSRPINIVRQTWDIGSVTPFINVFNPWQLFLLDDHVFNKLETFKLLHATLKLKFMVNGSPFHYGRVLVGVRPSKFDNNVLDLDMQDASTSTRFYDADAAAYKIQRSQRTLYSSRPHGFIDPCTNQPLIVELPFFAATNWLDLTDNEYWDRMGRIEMWELNQLRHANDATTDPVTISVFAWLENVTLTGLTAASPVTQSGEMKKKKSGKKVTLKGKKSGPNDEYGKGLVSAPATAVSEFASQFSDTPIIGRYARATAIAAESISSIASIFGFSRPPVITDQNYMKPTAVGSVAYTSGSDTIRKLTLDPKQELTIDPASVGLTGHDEMSFASIKVREAWIDTFNWLQSYDAGRKLYTILVHPMVAPQFTIGIDPIFNQTPLSFISTPFQYWTGTIRYRFQIVASNFHRGRLLFQYDPTPSAQSISPDYQARYSQIIDITEERDFTLEVKWAQADGYGTTVVRNSLPGVVYAAEGAAGTVTNIVGNNGILQVYVLNDLASPVDSSSLEINVFISGGEDYQVASPNNLITTLAYTATGVTVGPPVTTQSGEVVKSTTPMENLGGQTTFHTINGDGCACDPNINLVYFGEVVLSLRSLMKRYCFHRLLKPIVATPSVVNLNAYSQYNFPNGPGTQSYGSSIVSPITPVNAEVDPANACAMTYLRFFGQAYIGYRGGIRWKLFLFAPNPNNGVLRVFRSPYLTDTETAMVKVIASSGKTNLQSQVGMLGNNAVDEIAGAEITSSSVCSTLEYEVPFQTPYRYAEISEPNSSITDFRAIRRGGSHYISWTQYQNDANEMTFLESMCSIGVGP